jgi:hypothetical protein
MKNISLLVACIGLLLWYGLPSHAAAETGASAASQTIRTEEVKDAEAEAEQQKVSLADVEKSRALKGDRLYGLAGFWLLIALAVYLIRLQTRDDERLYDEGYYNKDPE